MTYAHELALNTHRIDPNPMRLPAPPSSDVAGDRRTSTDEKTTFCKPGVREANILSWCSIVFTLAAVISGLIVGAKTNSAAELGFAIENGVDFISSLIVLWRFGGGRPIPSEELELRELRASVGIALSFVALAIVCTAVAVSHLKLNEPVTHVESLLALSIPSFIVFAVLGGLKLWVGISTKSYAMKKDAACSICGAVLSLGVVIGVAADQHSGGDVWWFDAIVALVVSFVLFVYGMADLVKNRRYQWWSCRFWKTPTVRGEAAKRAEKGLEHADAAPVAMAAATEVAVVVKD